MGGGKVASLRKSVKDGDDFRRQLTAAERASLEDLRHVLGESKLIHNVSPSLAEAAGMLPDALSLAYAPDSSLPIVMGAQANVPQRDFELFMDPHKRRKASSGKPKTRLPNLPMNGGASMPPLGAYPDFVPGGEAFELPEIGGRRPGSSGGMGRTM